MYMYIIMLSVSASMYIRVKSSSRGGGACPCPGANMPAWDPLQLDPYLKYSNSATELPGDSVAQLVRAWQAICQVAGLSPSLSHCHCFLFRFISHLSFSMTLTSVKV